LQGQANMPESHQEAATNTGTSIIITTVREKVTAREVLGTVNPMEMMCTRTYSLFPVLKGVCPRHMTIECASGFSRVIGEHRRHRRSQGRIGDDEALPGQWNGGSERQHVFHRGVRKHR